MTRIALVSCVSKKLNRPAPARELYSSALFKKAARFANLRCDRWYILSAKYGLVSPDEVIAPYDVTLNQMTACQRKDWADSVWRQLRRVLSRGEQVVVLAGSRYREHLIPRITSLGCMVDIPMEGMGIGKQLQWLNHRPHVGIDRLYTLLNKLHSSSPRRILRTCTAAHGWPEAGVYFFFEPGEIRLDRSMPRIVRVGTHRVARSSKATLWNRLRTHRGTENGQGNHRSSIFRLHVGAALAQRFPSMHVPTWGVGQSADVKVRQRELPLERRVSEYIGSMSVAHVAALDDASPNSDRAFLERNLIGLLSPADYLADPPSTDWLGRYSTQERIRDSGLWNLDHIAAPPDPRCLDVLEELIDLHIRGKSPTSSLAPANWQVSRHLHEHPGQQILFGEQNG